jgi:hypothetical protein
MDQLSQALAAERCSYAFYENKVQAELVLFLIFPLMFNVEDICPKTRKSFKRFKGKMIHALLLNQIRFC